MRGHNTLPAYFLPTACALAFVWLAFACPLLVQSQSSSPEQRAVDFLAQEVPRWSKEHRCYSCHNNGDGARALAIAAHEGYAVPPDALKSTHAWLLQPDRWEQSVGNEDFKDAPLARLQFSAALAATVRDGKHPGRSALSAAGGLLIKDQRADGAWPLDAGGAIGSPVTYGKTLGTLIARNILEQADAARHRQAIAAADRWLAERQAASVLDAAAVLWSMQGPRQRPGKRVADCIDVIRRGESAAGGWGPYINSPPEAFDTAVVLLALNSCPEHVDRKQLLARGRNFLIAVQLEDGGWAETTRPRGGESYAQRISTTAWCTQALVTTRLRK